MTLFIACFLSLAAGGAGGFFGHKALDDQAEYQAYAAVIEPLIYYRDRLHQGKERGSNQTMRIVNYEVFKAQRDGLDVKKLLSMAQPPAKHPPALARLTTRRLIENLALAQQHGIYEGAANLEALAFGKSPTATRGAHVGQRMDVEHLVPKAIAPSLDNILANLMWLPASLNQSKGATITPEAMEMARVFHAEGILPHEEFLRVEEAFAGARGR